MIDEIARAGFKVMIFSGGEPLMRPDIYELVAHAASRGLRPVFGSNGTLITPEVAVRLKEAGACAMGISVDSLDAVKHDRFRGLEHAYDLTMRASRPASRRACRSSCTPPSWIGTATRCATSPTSRGDRRYGALRVLPHPRGARQVHPGDIARGAGERAAAQGHHDEGLAGAHRREATCAPQFTRVAKQLGVDTRFERGCLAGLTYCVIGSEGIVRPCAYMTEEAGDVRETPFDEIWRRAPCSRSCARRRTPARAAPATTRKAAAAVAPAPLLPRRRHPRSRRLLRPRQRFGCGRRLNRRHRKDHS